MKKESLYTLRLLLILILSEVNKELIVALLCEIVKIILLLEIDNKLLLLENLAPLFILKSDNLELNVIILLELVPQVILFNKKVF